MWRILPRHRIGSVTWPCTNLRIKEWTSKLRSFGCLRDCGRTSSLSQLPGVIQISYISDSVVPIQPQG